MGNAKSGKVVSLRAHKRKIYWSNVCACRITAMCWKVSVCALFFLGVCVLAGLFWLKSVNFILVTTCVGMVVIYAPIIYLNAKGIRKITPHHPNCLKLIENKSKQPTVAKQRS